MSELSDFLKNKKKELQEQGKVDSETVKKEWIQSLLNLYREMKQWLAEEEEQGLIKIMDDSVQLHEEGLGKYKAPALQLQTDFDTIYVTPVGRFLLGAKGRVDFYTTKERYLFLLSIDNEWVFTKDSRKGGYQKLTYDHFIELVKEVLS